MVAPLVAVGVGAGMGALSHLLGGGGGPQTTTTSLSQEDADAIRRRRMIGWNMFDQGMGAVDPRLLAAGQGYDQYAQFGQMGMNAFTDPSVLARFGAGRAQAGRSVFDWQRQQLENAHRKQMAGARAFGVRGQSMGPDYGQIDRSQQMFEIGNEQEAFNRAMQAAGLGQFGVAGQHNLGQYMTERPMNWQQHIMNVLQSAYGQPISTSTSSPNPNDRGNLFQSMLGGAMTGASFGGAGAPAAAVTQYAPNYGGVPNRWQPSGFGQYGGPPGYENY